MTALDKLTHDLFAPHVGTCFHVSQNDQKLATLELIEVRRLDDLPSARSFSLLWRGPQEAFLPQGMYLFSHAELPAVEIFVVPIIPDGTGYRYQAIFNRQNP